jgi:tetratricopeptide (TPR) repeat protein
VVRNIQLEPTENSRPHRPWQTLLYGHGTAAERAWVFAKLCQQQGMQVVMVGIEPAQADAKNADAARMYYLPALYTNGQLYLFDFQLGLPIPGPEGKGVATLEQARADDGLLRRLDLEDAPYPVTAEVLKTGKLFIVADTFSLSRRAAQLEAALVGEDHIAISDKPTELATKLKTVPVAEGIALWEVPFRTLVRQLTIGKAERHEEALAFEPFAIRPAFWKARTRQFQGRRKAPNRPGEDAIDDHQEAARLFMSRSVRPTDEHIKEAASSDERRVNSSAKRDATYWLGLLSYDDGKFAVAADWLRRPELNTADSPWRTGALYNLARCLEAEGKLDEAIQILESDSSSPQQNGNKLRARDLKTRAKEAAAKVTAESNTKK